MFSAGSPIRESMALPPAASLAASHSPPFGAGQRILLADEMAAGHGDLALRLAGAGYRLEIAKSVEEALAQLREHEVELMLLGEKLSGTSGLDFLRLLRAAWTPQQLPVIVLAPEGERDALEAGANDWLAPSADSSRTLVRIRSQLCQKDAGFGIRETAERVFRATAVSTDVMWEWNVATGVFWFSADWHRLLGCAPPGPARLDEWLALIHPDDSTAMQRALDRLREDALQFDFEQEYRLAPARGDSRWIYCRANVERDRDGRLLRLTGLQTDITRNKCVDWLTQLPNREEFLARIDSLLRVRRARTGNAFALLLLDLDRFRVVNESLGPAAGDRLLREVAQRLERATRSMANTGRAGDSLARVHGDQFVLVLSDVGTAETARTVADRLQSQIRHPFQIAGREVRLSASIGIVICPADTEEAGPELLRDAEIALRQAKTMGRARAVAFSEEMRREALLRMELEMDLRHALERKELELFYQPKIGIESGELEGFEALIRWRHPRLGLVAPMAFIPIAEETGMILQIGAWAMEESARQFARWRELLPESNLQVSVNLSVKQFFDRELVEQVARIVKERGLPRGSLCLEITESVLIGEMQTAAEILQRLHAAGVGLVIDDFGTGYSSLNYLTNLPFDTLKIDRSFVSRLEDDSNCSEVVKAVVSLAGNLRMDVIAEGVETPEQLRHLRRIGCQSAQGFYFASAVDASSATGMVLASRQAC